MKILVLGANGLLGNAVFRVLNESAALQVSGTVRRVESHAPFAPELRDRLVQVGDLETPDELVRLLEETAPEVIVNCLSLGKASMDQPMRAISVLALLPQRIGHLCERRGTRLVHISSDGVFSGSRGGYSEEDLPDAADLYGITKLLGEVHGGHAVSLRTSIIGPDPFGGSGLLEWFLAQRESCRCYTRAIFSGFPTVELARIIRDVVLPNATLQGTYHVAAQPISKFDLLALVARRWEKRIEMIPDDSVALDRSLLAERFAHATGYVAPAWPRLVDEMYSYQSGLARK